MNTKEDMQKWLQNFTYRGHEWVCFAQKVYEHIVGYTIPQYGDKGKDIATDYTPEYCVSQIDKYVRRFGKNIRPGQEKLDLVKIAHYAQLAYTKLEEREKQNVEAAKTGV